MPFSTDDLAAWQAKKSPPAQSALADVELPRLSEPIRYSLRELLIAVTVIGVLLGLLRAAGIFGAVLAFLATAIFTWVVYPKMKPRDLYGQQAMFDFLWGVGMPLVCLVFDPFLFKQADAQTAPFGTTDLVSNSLVYDHGFFAYAFVGCQMLTLTVLLVLGGRVRRFDALLGGFLASGLMFATVVALLLVIPATFGVFLLGIGLLGFTPLITTYVYGRQCQRSLANAWEEPTLPVAAPLAALGFFASLLIPAILGGIRLAVLRPGALTQLLQR